MAITLLRLQRSWPVRRGRVSGLGPTDPARFQKNGNVSRLEAPDIWPDFHDSLAATIRAELNARLPEPYYARLQMWPELGVVLQEGVLHRTVPDVVVAQRPERAAALHAARVTSEPRTIVSDGVQVRVHTDPLRHHFIEIRDAARAHRLITLIEIVSPSNKYRGPDRRAYEMKQREILDSDAHPIELDLLRAGTRPLPYPELSAAIDRLEPDYLVLLNRGNLRQENWMDYTLYPVHLREALPVIPVPLSGAVPDVPLDLQTSVQRAYIDGPYRRALDYSQRSAPASTVTRRYAMA
jgi:hypothetical protein